MKFVGWIVAGLLLTSGISGCSKSNSSGGGGSDSGLASFEKLIVEDLEPGKGEAAVNGDKLILLYRGTLTNGKEFDGNMSKEFVPDEAKDPFTLVLGSGSVIKGWDEGLVGAKEGMVRRLKIPYAKGYGETGSAPKIPGKADLIFDVKVLAVMKSKTDEEITVDVNDTKAGTGAEVKETSTVVFKYTGKLLNGKVFDEQTAKNITAPVARLAPGFKQGMVGMKKGGKRTIKLNPKAASFNTRFPFGQILQFDVELIDVK